MALVYRCAHRLVCLAIVLSVVTAAGLAQESPSASDIAVPHIGVPEDWSTQHVIYTRNGSVEDMMKVRNDPRFLNSYLLHWMREHRSQAQPAGISGLNENRPGEDLQPQSPDEERDRVRRPPVRTRSRVDWAVSLGAGGTAIGESPAKYTFSTSATPSCSDFLVFSTKGTPAAGGQSNLVGLTRLYSNPTGNGFCSGTGTTGQGPSFLFSYAIGSGPSYLSPVLSLHGDKVAWIETNSSNHAILHITTWVSGQGTDATHAVAPTGTWSSATNSCTPAGSSCDVALDYTSSAYSGCSASVDSNTNSDLYVDYDTDTGFLGADNGLLYHVKTIFTGTPTIDFCIPVHAGVGTALSGAVYGSLLNPPEVFISDSKILYAYTVGASSFTLKAQYTYGNGTLTGPGPLLDAVNGWIYMFSAQDNEPTNMTSVTQLSTDLTTHVTVVPLGAYSTNSWPILFYGAFDNNYYNNGPANASSTLYSCGEYTGHTNAQALYAISFNATTGVANTTPAMSANPNVDPGNPNGTCSPITEFFDGSTDRLFIGMGQHGATSGANLVTMWNVNSRPTSTTAATATTNNATNPYYGGTSGIIVDNNANGTMYPQAASIYFSTLWNNGTVATCGAVANFCAVKLTQSSLN